MPVRCVVPCRPADIDTEARLPKALPAIVLICAAGAIAPALAAPDGGPLSRPISGPVTVMQESLVVHGQRRLAPAPDAARVVPEFEDHAYSYHGWQPGNGRDPNTDAFIAPFGTAYGESSPAPGANLSAPGTISPIQSGLRR